RVSHPLDERRRVPPGVVHDHARADGLALEPHPPPHRHPDRRARPGDRGDAAAAAGEDPRQLLRPGGGARWWGKAWRSEGVARIREWGTGRPAGGQLRRSRVWSSEREARYDGPGMEQRTGRPPRWRREWAGEPVARD